MPADVNWAAYIGIPLAMAAGGTGEQAVALSVPLSMLGLGLFNFIMTINAYFPHMGDKAAAKGDGAGIHRATYLAAAPSFIPSCRLRNADLLSGNSGGRDSD